MQSSGSNLVDAVENGIIDLYVCKKWAMKYAVDAASTILKVDKIIMAKKAGGPKAGARPPGAGSDDEM